MLARSQRLSRTQFSQYFKTGKRIHGDCVTIVFTPFPTLHGSVVVSKKVAKSAVTRNTLRRRVYSQLRSVATTQTGIYIVILKPGFTTLSRIQAQSTIQETLKKITHHTK